jgi:peroxiredoxin Q/BCP
MLKTGSRAPEFSLPNENDQEVSLTDLLNNGPLILYFYPADFTTGCTKEACSFRDLHDELLKVRLQVVGVSPQSPESHQQFKDKHNLPFTLLSDMDKAVIGMYGVDGPLGFGVRRATFLINPDRTIKAAVLADFRIDRHADFIRHAITIRNAAMGHERSA